MSQPIGHKILVLIDGSNLFHSFSQIKIDSQNYRIDFNKLQDLLTSEFGDIEKVCYFSAEPPEGTINQSRRRYLRLLKRIGFDVRTVALRNKTFKCKECKSSFNTLVEKGLDVALASEALKYGLQGLCDAVVIISGSGSYIPVVDMLQGAGVFVAVAAFKDHCSINLDLTTRPNSFLNLSDHAEELRLVPEERHNTVSPNPYDTQSVLKD